MHYLPLIGSMLFFLLVIYCWNRFVVVNLIQTVVKRSQQFTATKTEKTSSKFVIQHEQQITKGLQLFFWMVGLVLILLLIINESSQL